MAGEDAAYTNAGISEAKQEAFAALEDEIRYRHENGVWRYREASSNAKTKPRAPVGIQNMSLRDGPRGLAVR